MHLTRNPRACVQRCTSAAPRAVVLAVSCGSSTTGTILWFDHRVANRKTFVLYVRVFCIRRRQQRRREPRLKSTETNQSFSLFDFVFFFSKASTSLTPYRSLESQRMREREPAAKERNKAKTKR